jgi:hypothetical protein
MFRSAKVVSMELFEGLSAAARTDMMEDFDGSCFRFLSLVNGEALEKEERRENGRCIHEWVYNWSVLQTERSGHARFQNA